LRSEAARPEVAQEVCLQRMLMLIAGLAGTSLACAAGLHGLAAAARAVGADQGVYVEATDGTVLVAQAAARPVHPASVSKVAASLALLRRFGPDHRLVTTVATRGQVRGGTLYGDLLIDSSGDPSLVDEDALLIAARLNARGISSVAGTVVAQGPLIFDWQTDADAARLRAALAGMTSPSAWAVVQAFESADAEPPSLPSARPLLQFSHAAVLPALASAPAGEPVSGVRILLVRRSQPLLALAKSLNDYSNNIIDPLAQLAGGAAAVESVARSVLPEDMRAEIVLGDAAGTDPRNRLSPRAAVRLLRALERELQASGHNLCDILPVAGIDQGTLHDRLNGPDLAGRVVGKTGTFGSYGASALIGAIATRDRGTVYFAILDHDIPVPQARRRQDHFVASLLQALHPLPWRYAPDLRPAIAREELSAAP
jgi:serine-type D-Ala-D-Ala carboxypeptidase/endopeptidase (penicillin-binding protein 4)